MIPATAVMRVRPDRRSDQSLTHRRVRWSRQPKLRGARSADAAAIHSRAAAATLVRRERARGTRWADSACRPSSGSRSGPSGPGTPRGRPCCETTSSTEPSTRPHPLHYAGLLRPPLAACFGRPRMRRHGRHVRLPRAPAGRPMAVVAAGVASLTGGALSACTDSATAGEATSARGADRQQAPRPEEATGSTDRRSPGDRSLRAAEVHVRIGQVDDAARADCPHHRRSPTSAPRAIRSTRGGRAWPCSQTSVWIDTVFPPVGTVPAKGHPHPLRGRAQGSPLGAPRSTPRCWPPA